MLLKGNSFREEIEKRDVSIWSDGVNSLSVGKKDVKA